MSFTEEQITIIETIISKRILDHDQERSNIRRELMSKLNLLKEGEDENIRKYVFAVKTKINYDTTNSEIVDLIDELRDTIKTYKLLSKQASLEQKYSQLLKCNDLKEKLDLNWNPSCDDEIIENISTLKKLIIDFPTRKRWWNLF